MKNQSIIFQGNTPLALSRGCTLLPDSIDQSIDVVLRFSLRENGWKDSVTVASSTSKASTFGWSF